VNEKSPGDAPEPSWKTGASLATFTTLVLAHLSPSEGFLVGQEHDEFERCRKRNEEHDLTSSAGSNCGKDSRFRSPRESS